LHSTVVAYPASSAERDRWIIEHRPQRNELDPAKPYAFFLESERTSDGGVVEVATIFLTNRECPWKCVFCDLWKNTLTYTVPLGAIPAQIEYALSRLPPAGYIKLYNSGSFFDRRAVPREDYASIARLVRSFERVIVECHPALIQAEVLKFRKLVAGALEVAMGLETVHPGALDRLNKRVTVEQFARAANLLRSYDIPLRVFILVHPPFVPSAEAEAWVRRSIDFAFECGAAVCSLIPTRSGNGALEALAAQGEFSLPPLSALEDAIAYGVNLRRGRVFADLWDLKKFSRCSTCFAARVERLDLINKSQSIPAAIVCPQCGRR